MVLQDVLEHAVIDAEHHVGIHLDEAAVAVVGEARIARAGGEALHGRVVEAEIENGVHHAGHGGARAGAHGDEQRIGGIAECGADCAADLGQRRLDLGLEACGQLAAAGVVGGADLGGDREARRNRQAEARHLGEVGALAAQQVAHVGCAVRDAAAEAIDPFGLRRGGTGGGWRGAHGQLSGWPRRSFHSAVVGEWELPANRPASQRAGRPLRVLGLM